MKNGRCTCENNILDSQISNMMQKYTYDSVMCSLMHKCDLKKIKCKSNRPMTAGV